VLLNAVYDDSTIWPNGLDPAAQGAVRRAWPHEPAAAPAVQEAAPTVAEAVPTMPEAAPVAHEVPHGAASAETEGEDASPEPAVGWPHETQAVPPPAPPPEWPPQPAAPDLGTHPHEEWRDGDEDEPGLADPP
jgi:hypothetical protein